MREIELTQELYTQVDDEDYDWLSQWNWYAHKQKGTYYAKRTTGKDYKVTIVHMHREIMKCPKGKRVDHKDGNGLNNQKHNLRICSVAQNGMNRGKQVNNSSGYKGVGWDKARNKWRAQIMVDQKGIPLGRFDNLMDAVRAYDEAAIKYFGEFAVTNLPQYDVKASNQPVIKWNS